VAVVAAVTLHHGESAVKETPAAGKLFPTSRGSLTTRHGRAQEEGRASHAARSGDGWVLAEKNGYPVDMSAVRKTLIGLSSSRRPKPGPRDPKLYSKLGVEDPDAEGATSTLLTVKDEERQGACVARRRQGRHAGKRLHRASGLVRKPEETRSWLASGDLDLKEKSADWLDKKILEVKRERIRAAEFAVPTAKPSSSTARKPETKDFTLHDSRKGRDHVSLGADLASQTARYLNLRTCCRGRH
jgi:hypothetical protein